MLGSASYLPVLALRTECPIRLRLTRRTFATLAIELPGALASLIASRLNSSVNCRLVPVALS